MKRFTLLLTALCLSLFVFGQNHNSLLKSQDIYGTYEGVKIKMGATTQRMPERYRISIKENNRFSLEQQLNGSWKLLRTDAFEVYKFSLRATSGNIYYEYNIPNSSSPYKSLTVCLPSQKYKQITKVQEILLTLTDRKTGDLITFDTRRQGGNPNYARILNRLQTGGSTSPQAQNSRPPKLSRNSQIDEHLKTFILAALDDQGGHRKNIIKRVEEVSSWMSADKMQSVQVSMRYVESQLGLIINYDLADAEKALKAAKKEAERTNCKGGLSTIKAIESKFYTVRDYFVDARNSLSLFISYPSNSNLRPHFESFQNNFQKALDTSITFEKEITAYDKNPCRTAGGASISSSRPSNSSSSSSGTYSNSYSSGSGVGVGFKLRGNSYSGFFRAGYPQEGWAARKAGISEGMRIFEINGKKLDKSLSKAQVEAMLKGKAGTSIKIKAGTWDKPEYAKTYLLYRGEGGKGQLVGATPPKSKIKPLPSQTQPRTQTQTSTQTSSSLPVSYPTFTGSYAGDNLLLLFGRKLDDPAVQQLLNDASWGFKELTVRPKPGEKTYYASDLRTGLKFKDGVLIRMSFSSSQSYKPENHFKGALPLAIPLTKSSAGMKGMPDSWVHINLGGMDQWTLKKYGLSFKVKGNPEKKIVTGMEIEARDVKDWNGYYAQFED